MTSLDAGSREFLLALADDEHLVGARHTAWIGLGPFLEEDLAFCSIAQDELGHAIGLYELLLLDEGRDPDTDLDHFALFRSPGDYRSSHLAERECNDWADSLVRHWLYDTSEQLRWSALTDSSVPGIGALADRVLAEERFHTEHAERFMARVATTPEIDAAVRRLLPLAVAAWSTVPGEAAAIASGVVTRSSTESAAIWASSLDAQAASWGLSLVWPDEHDPAVTEHADRLGRSDEFEDLQRSLTRVLVEDPAARW